MTYEEYVDKRIFEPLGMTRSMYCNGSESVPRRAHGHGLRNAVKPFVRVIPIVHTATCAAGAICSTAEDPITWLQALHGGKVLTPKSYTEMMTPSRLKLLLEKNKLHLHDEKKQWPVTLRQLMAQVAGVRTDPDGDAPLSNTRSGDGNPARRCERTVDGLHLGTIHATPAPPRSCPRRLTSCGSGWASTAARC
jgi:Beta-lactamase